MTSSTMFASVLCFAVLVSPTAGDEIRRWRDAEGKLHLSIEGSEQGFDPDEEGAQVLGARKVGEEEKFSVEVSLRRREIERRMVEASAELERLRGEIAESESSEMLLYTPQAPEDPEDVQFVLDAQRNAFLAAQRFQAEKQEKLERLRREERVQLLALKKLWRKLDRLRTEVRERYKGLPGWWRDRLDCPACPSPQEVASALRRRDETEDEPPNRDSPSDATGEEPPARAE